MHDDEVDFNGVEYRLFVWEDWFDVGNFTFNFLNVTLKTQIGIFPTGTEFKRVWLDFNRSYAEFFLNDIDEKPALKARLTLQCEPI